MPGWGCGPIRNVRARLWAGIDAQVVPTLFKYGASRTWLVVAAGLGMIGNAVRCSVVGCGAIQCSNTVVHRSCVVLDPCKVRCPRQSPHGPCQLARPRVQIVWRMRHGSTHKQPPARGGRPQAKNWGHALCRPRHFSGAHGFNWSQRPEHFGGKPQQMACRHRQHGRGQRAARARPPA